MLTAIAIGLGPWPMTHRDVHAQDATPAIVGAWTLNHELSDKTPERPADEAGERGRGRRGDGGGGRGLGRGGFGGGRGRGGGQGRGGMDPEEMVRLRDATRDLLSAPEHLTIVSAGNLIIITGPDGRTTRLSPDGEKIKDESTKTDRRTKWESQKLVSEIGGLPGGKVVETYGVDPERRQLHITVRRDDDRRPLAFHRVYDERK